MQRSLFTFALALIAGLWIMRALLRSLARLRADAGGASALDLRPLGYDAAGVRAYFERLGAPGRQYYLKKHIRLDAVFAIVYGLAGASIGLYFAAVLTNAGWTFLAWLPFVGGFLLAGAALVDVDEGVAIGRLLRAYPALTEAAVRRAARATRLKWLLGGVGTVLIALAALLAAATLLKG